MGMVAVASSFLVAGDVGVDGAGADAMALVSAAHFPVAPRCRCLSDYSPVSYSELIVYVRP